MSQPVRAVLLGLRPQNRTLWKSSVSAIAFASLAAIALLSGLVSLISGSPLRDLAGAAACFAIFAVVACSSVIYLMFATAEERSDTNRS